MAARIHRLSETPGPIYGRGGRIRETTTWGRPPSEDWGRRALGCVERVSE